MINILQWVGIGALLAVMAMLGYQAFSRSEMIECHKWEAQASTYSDFFISPWQDEQCRSYDIIIDAPVR